MTDVQLTPIERGVLVVLMAEARPLKENADLKKTYKLGMTASHRKKLTALKFISTSSSPFEHSLTSEGWDFLMDEMRREDVPSGLMGQGALVGLMRGVANSLEALNVTAEDFFAGRVSQSDTKPVDPEAEHFANAAWSNSEEALAFANQDISSFERVLKRFDGSSETALQRSVRQIELAAKAIFQNIRLAADQRSLISAYEVGDEVDFDAALFDSLDGAQPGERVIVRKPPIVKRISGGEVVVAKGVAE